MAQALAKYRSMRDFSLTPEPSGGKPTKTGDSFVIQKHAASHLHYDFRLELDGVLLSWAVPKGPSLKAGERRLAMQTEDHPLDYGGFEGIIPQGEYGGGSVIIWDRGRWTPDGDPRAGLKKGHLAFELHGEKLGGRWHLVRTKDRQWLLFKSKDEAATGVDIVKKAPNSVLSGKSVEQVGEKPDRMWTGRFKNITKLVQTMPTKVDFTNLDKVLYEDVGVTKSALIAYYASVANFMLPLISDRPLALVRCPNGHKGQCFFQKHAKQTHAAVGRVVVEADGDEHTYIKDLDSVFALVQLGVLEMHTWGCHVDNVDRPDQLVIDLDPDEGLPFERVSEDAVIVRDYLGDLGLESLVKTTGGKGLHVVVPVKRGLDWDEFKQFSHDVVLKLEELHPERYVTNMAKKARKGKVFLDYLRNGRGATAIGAYSTRARDGATVSAPITWKELEAGVDPKEFNVLTMAKRPNVWRDYGKLKQSITAKMRKRVKS